MVGWLGAGCPGSAVKVNTRGGQSRGVWAAGPSVVNFHRRPGIQARATTIQGIP